MKKSILILFGVIVFILGTAAIFNKVDFRKGRNYNVCKSLNGDILVYVIFVDSKTTAPWTEFDIQTTRDSINNAVAWLQNQAASNGIDLNIKTDMYMGTDYSTIKRDLPEGSVRKSVTTPNMAKGTAAMNKWSDYIARKAGATFNILEKDGIPEIKNPKNKERLVAFLRDEHKVESVAFLLMVNNYYRDDISIALNTMSDSDIEYAVVSYKYSSGIAHNILHLFGAADLYETLYRKSDKNINYALQEFSNEIMQNPYAKNVNSLSLSNFTKYLIGWGKDYDPKYEQLFVEKGIKIK